MVRYVCLILLWSGSGLSMSVHAETLSLDAALTLAEQHSPDLAAQTAAVSAARSLSVAAGTLPEPQLKLGVENVPVSGADQWSLQRDAMTMRTIGVMQEFPNGKKRAAQTDVANAALANAQAEQRVRRLAVRRDAALAWFNRYYLEQRLVLFDALERETQLFAATVQAQLAGGQGMPADGVMPQLEAAELADRRDELTADITKAKASLRRLIGDAAESPLPDDAPRLALDIDTLRAHVHEHAELQAFAPLMMMAQAEVHEAEAMKRPDWGIELSYGRRGRAFDDMVSAQLVIGLPFFSGTRIEPQIAAKRAAVSRVAAERDAMLLDHTQEMEAEIAEYQATTRQLTRLREVRVPLAQRKIDLQLASYQANKLDLSTLLQARRALLDEKLKLIELEAAQTALAAKLYYAYGEGAQ